MTQSALEKMAKAGYEAMFEDKWDDLDENSIVRAHWLEISKAMILSFDFRNDFLKLHRKVFMRLSK